MNMQEIMYLTFGILGLIIAIFWGVWLRRNKEWTDWVGFALLGLIIAYTLNNLIALILLLTLT